MSLGYFDHEQERNPGFDFSKAEKDPTLKIPSEALGVFHFWAEGPTGFLEYVVVWKSNVILIGPMLNSGGVSTKYYFDDYSDIQQVFAKLGAHFKKYKVKDLRYHVVE
ncbi:MAG TPA: hypothetical protein PKX78_01220 [Candidatus Woesebacteria bacterium]|nr:hypothetical protein [Candidatus Woesebacteria bacterium]